MEYPRIKHLPSAEQAAFRLWLKGKTQPLGAGHEDMARGDWDWYYPWDYVSWKANSG